MLLFYVKFMELLWTLSLDRRCGFISTTFPLSLSFHPYPTFHTKVHCGEKSFKIASVFAKIEANFLVHLNSTVASQKWGCKSHRENKHQLVVKEEKKIYLSEKIRCKITKTTSQCRLSFSSFWGEKAEISWELTRGRIIYRKIFSALATTDRKRKWREKKR